MRVAATRIATLGAALSANRGAASMLQAVADNVPDAQLSVLTTFPADDRVEVADDRMTIVSAEPVELAAVLWPLAVVIALLRICRLPWGWLCVRPALRHLRDADVVVDVAGISFADGRGFAIVVYNALMTSLPLLLGRPTVKLSQAMGPFRSPLNRVLARIVLPRLRAVCARGAGTEAHCADLGLRNVTPAADLAFTMKSPPASSFDRPTVGLAPSGVVHGYCTKAGIDYPSLLASFVDQLVAERDVDVVVFPHSSRPEVTGGRMDDRPVCRAVHALVASKDRCRLVDEPLDHLELRSLIAGCDLLVTSRFHAMISALATTTPVLVVGWSHKYREVLDEVGLDGCEVDWRAADAALVLARASDLLDRADEVKATIEAALPAIRERSMRNYEVVVSTLRAHQG